jgi:DMSO reductase anchor subunit
MHPALSVIFFTTLSGAGYGLLFWAGWHALTAQSAARTLLVSIALAIVLSTIGLLSSMLHLGKPMRAWRAFSQWRTSWLSREGVSAMATFFNAAAIPTGCFPPLHAG